MLKRENRLKKRYQYNYVYRAGSKASGNAITLFASASKTKNIKVGFSVTKKVGKATRRNLARRRLREIVQKQLPKLKQNFNIIVVAHENILSFDFATISNEFEKLVKKLGLYKNEESI